MKKLFGILVLIILLGLLGWQIYQRISESGASSNSRGGLPGGFGGNTRGGPDSRFARPAVAVEVAEIQQQTIQDVGQFTGSLLPKSQFVVTPKVSGRLEQLLVNVGDHVENDQLIATLDDEMFQQQVKKAKAELEVANATLAESRSALAIAKREVERAETLSQRNILSQSGLDKAQATYNAAVARQKVARATVTNRKSGLQTAQLSLSYTQIKVNWNSEDGDHTRVVGERFVDEGAILKANDPIVSILDLGTIICVINVIEQDYFRVRKDLKAIISTDALPEKTFAGSVVRIAPILQETSRQARVEIEILNPDELLKPGMFVRVNIEFDKIENATVIPMAALVTRNEQQGVFLADLQNMAAHFVPVMVGVSNSEQVQILEPSLSGSVITMGQYLLEDGGSILLPDQQAPENSSGRPEGQPEGQRRRPQKPPS